VFSGDDDMKYSFKIGSVFGIPIELHITFIILLLVVLAFSAYYFILVIFLFVFVTLHELSHSLVAKHYNIRVQKIVLYPIGGASQIEDVADKPNLEWRLSIAGPLASFVIGLCLFALDLIIPINAPFATTRRLFYDLALLNVLLGAFNLIPAFPMDGGRVLRAYLAEKKGLSDATKYTSWIGRILALIMIGVGVLVDWWLILIGVFIYVGATEERERPIRAIAGSKVRAKDIMNLEIATVTPENSLNEALEVMFRAKYHDALVEKDGNFMGIIAWNDLLQTLPEQRDSIKISQLPLRVITVFPNDSILEIYKKMTKENIDMMPVVEQDNPNQVIGVITDKSLSSAYEKAKSHQ
jgi:Zn-dependent protease/CBS domain-containing protein